MKYLIVGLGNIGEEYDGTRHNIGFEVVESLGKKLGGEWKSVKHGSLCEVSHKGRKLLLLISFNLVGALTLLVIDKRKDFVLFRNLGMEQRAISWVVFWEGVWVSVWGTVVGLLLGVGLVVLQINTHWVSTQGTFSIPYPVELRMSDLFLILLLKLS